MFLMFAAIREISFLRLPALQMSTSTSSLMPRGNLVFNSSSTVNLCLCLPTVFSFSPGSASTARQSAHRLAKQRMESNGSNLISISSISGPNDTSAFFPLCTQLGHKRPVVLPPTPTHLPLLLFHPLLVSTFRRPRPPPTTRDHHSKRGRNFLEWDATDHMSELSHARWMRSIRRPCPRLGQPTKKGEKKKQNKEDLSEWREDQKRRRNYPLSQMHNEARANRRRHVKRDAIKNGKIDDSADTRSQKVEGRRSKRMIRAFTRRKRNRYWRVRSDADRGTWRAYVIGQTKR